MLQEILGEPVTPSTKLRGMNCESLALQLAEMQQRLRDRPAGSVDIPTRSTLLYA